MITTATALDQLISLLNVELVETNLFRGESVDPGWKRVYGGQVLGQALAAAARTVADDRAVHSLHGYFLLAGDTEKPINYAIERTRDGRSFSTRLVKALQGDATIFTMTASFHVAEDGLDHADAMPNVPAPDALPSAQELVAANAQALPKAMLAYWSRDRAFDFKPVDFSRYLTRAKAAPQQMTWMRASGDVGSDPVVHRALLAYASDFTFLDTALIAHGRLLFDAEVQMASIDHAMWFHRPFRFDDWLLFVQESPSASGARGYCRGKIFDQSGRLIATAAQEGLVRLRTR